MKRNKTKGFQKKEVLAAQMVREAKTGNWKAYTQWLQQCELENNLTDINNGEFYIAD